MRKHFEKKTVVVLILSLLLASRYVEYGKRVKASETEQKVQIEGEGEIMMQKERELHSETETEPETETESETEAETQTKSETELESEIESGSEATEKTTEADTEDVTEKSTEADTEELTEKSTEPDTEDVTEKSTEAETEDMIEKSTELDTEKETAEAETQTEPKKQIMRVSNIHVLGADNSKIYDGTDRIELGYDVEIVERREAEDLPQITYEAHLAGSDVGEWAVAFEFDLDDTGAEVYQLEVEETPLTARILPRELTVMIPDGWKTYGSAVKMENVHLLGKVQVSGFLRDENGNEIVPEGFEMPDIALNTSVIEPHSDIYEQGRQKIYQDALVLRKNKKGKLSGNPTDNYVFSQDAASGKYKTGSLVIAQSRAVLGSDYELGGKDGTFYRTEDGTLWVQRGASIEAYPLENSGYNQGAEMGDLQQRGTFSFSLKRRNKNGEITADSLEETVEFSVDGEVPEAVVSVENAREAGGIFYGSQGVSVIIRVPEDSESGMKNARYFVAASRDVFNSLNQNGEEWWQDCLSGTRLDLTQDGTYVVYVETEDHVGNKAWVRSSQIMVDSEAPGLSISGVENNSANGGAVRVAVACSDTCYRSGSLQVELNGANGGIAPALVRQEENDQGAEIIFEDFPYSKAFDDIYTLRAAAEDLAGNQTEEQITFSVNRFGSVYDLTDETRQALSQFYHREAFPVVFLETNIDDVGEVQILCRKDGSMRELAEGKDYTVRHSGGSNTWKRYSYTVSQQVFAQEGMYEVILLSTDRAKNSADSQTQEKAVSFAIDRTPPECFITGLEKERIYRAKEVWACLEPRDNGSLKEMKLYLDGQLAYSCDGEEIQRQGGIIKWKAEAKMSWQRLQVYVLDEAGNEFWTEELPCYITDKEEVDIEPYVKTEKSARELEELKRSAGGERKGKDTLQEDENSEEDTLIKNAGLVVEGKETQNGLTGRIIRKLQSVWGILFLLVLLTILLFIFAIAAFPRIRK